MTPRKSLELNVNLIDQNKIETHKKSLMMNQSRHCKNYLPINANSESSIFNQNNTK